MLQLVGYKETWRPNSPPATMLACQGAWKGMLFGCGNHSPFLGGERSGLQSMVWELLQMPEKPLEVGMHPSLFPLSRGPSLVECNYHTSCLGSGSRILSCRMAQLPQKEWPRLLLVIAYTLVVRAVLAGEKCTAQSCCSEKGRELGSPLSFQNKIRITGWEFIYFPVQADPSFTSI